MSDPKQPHQLSERFADADLVDAVFAYCWDLMKRAPDADPAELKEALRDEFAGIEVYIRKNKRQALARQVLAIFNGRNATEVARTLNISRATVYRLLKQPGGKEAT